LEHGIPALEALSTAMVAADVVGSAIGAPDERGAGGRYLQRVGQCRVGNRDAIQFLPIAVTTKHRVASMTGPICVDEFVVTSNKKSAPFSASSSALVKRDTMTTMKQAHYASDVVDLDVLSDTELVDGQYRLSPMSPHNNPSGGETIETGSTSECSTDDSYQADLRNGNLSSSSDDDNDPGESRKRVSFSEVSLRVYAPMVSDSPNASATYPIGLDWKHTEAVTLPLEEFEDEKTSRASSPDDQVALLRGFRRPRRLSPIDRFHLISDLSGLSHGEIYELEHARARRHHHCSKPTPPEYTPALPTSSTTPKCKSCGGPVYQVVDIDSGYQRVDV
jgi:hypothetical protein